jgi:hypothetical protein
MGKFCGEGCRELKHYMSSESLLFPLHTASERWTLSRRDREREREKKEIVGK